jgi:fucose 4-O-acetylase-like acetyltransferase
VETQERVWLWDNAKALLIFCVVVGHVFVASSGGDQFERGIELIIYSFHMPLFILIAGYFGKRVVTSKSFPTQKIIGFLSVYLAMKVLLYLFEGILRGSFTGINLSLFETSDAPWYVLAMAIWITGAWLIFYVNPNINKGKLLLFAIVAGVLIGFDDDTGDYLALLRTVNFFPFFIAGICLKPAWVERLRTPKIRLLACVVVLLAALLIIWKILYFSDLWQFFTGRHRYENIATVPDWSAPLYRLGHYLFAGVIGASVIAIMPNRRLPIVTVLGQRTMQVYFYQTIITQVLEFFAIPSLLVAKFLWPGVLLVCGAAVILLSWKPIGLPVTWLLRGRFQSPKSKRKEVLI